VLGLQPDVCQRGHPGRAGDSGPATESLTIGELRLEGTLGGRPRPPDFGDHPNATVVVAEPGSRLRLAAGLLDEVDPAVGTYGLRRPSHGDTTLISL